MEGFLPVIGVFVVGGLIQYFRAFKSFPEPLAWLITAVAGVGVYWLGTDGAALGSKEFIREALLWVMAARGGTSAASGLSHVTKAVPVTNSK